VGRQDLLDVAALHRLTVVRRQGNAKGYLAPDRVDELIDWLRKLQTAMRDGAAVTVMFVGANERELEQHRPALERIVGHLRRHGINATLEETLRAGLPISDILLSRAADFAADLIVTGGYHHSQLREALIGGVSRELLEHMTVPVLMSH